MMGYAETMFPYAQRAHEGTGLPVSLVIAQWWNESAAGTSSLARQHNNHGGIKYTKAGAEYEAGPYAGYRSIDAFVRDYVRVLNLSYYAEVRRVARSGAGVEEVARALGRSPYAESGYGQGENLIALIRGQNLTRFDRPGSAPSGPGPGGIVVERQDGPPVSIDTAGLGPGAAWVLIGLGFLLLAKTASKVVQVKIGGDE